jgi:hypothetical protein
MVDQKGSLGFVGDVFEVMAQVDCRLTTLLTGSIGLISRPKTWGVTSGLTETSSHGNPRTCQGCPGG